MRINKEPQKTFKLRDKDWDAATCSFKAWAATVEKYGQNHCKELLRAIIYCDNEDDDEAEAAIMIGKVATARASAATWPNREGGVQIPMLCENNQKVQIRNMDIASDVTQGQKRPGPRSATSQETTTRSNGTDIVVLRIAIEKD